MIKIVNSKLDSDFNDPLGLLSDCHRRIERFLDQLLRVAETAGAAPLNAEGREDLEAALRYFRKAAPLHTADEESSLFPILRDLARAGHAEAVRAMESIARLEADHRVADSRHAAIDEIGRRWLADGSLTEPEVARWIGEIKSLRQFYAAHIAMEDEQLFPLSRRLLANGSVERVGREMAARRGLDYDALSSKWKEGGWTPPGRKS